MTPEIVRGETYHCRIGGPKNAFRYGVDYFLIDPEAETAGPLLFSRNRFNIACILDRDHGGRRGGGAGTAWVRAVLRDHGYDALAGMRVLLLAQPRLLGHWFNPVSFWLVLDDEDALRAVIAEVNNTFAQRHSYLCAHEDGRPIGPKDVLRATKVFYVSPFLPSTGTYAFRFAVEADRIDIHIDYRHGEGKGGGLVATLTGSRAPATSPAILASLFRRPVGSLRVLSLIHFQALKLRLKGARFRSPPTPPAAEVSR